MKHLGRLTSLILIMSVFAPLPLSAAQSPLRAGYFTNITHAQAIAGKASGIFERKTGAVIDWKAFNAGPSAMEGLLSGAIDIAYVGPNPAVNAYIRSRGQSLRIIAGASSGGAALVVRTDAGIRTINDFKGKRVASPALGNTQDIALRHWLKSQGLDPKRDVRILTQKNPDILMLFQQKNIDAAWVPEPWVTRLIREGSGSVFLDERKLWPAEKFTSAVLVVRSDFLKRNRETVRNFVDAHVEITQWLAEHPTDASKILNGELAKLMRKPMPEKILHEALSRLTITYDPIREALVTSARHAWSLGLLPGNGKSPPDLSQAFDLSILNEVLRARHKPQVR